MIEFLRKLLTIIFFLNTAYLGQKLIPANTEAGGEEYLFYLNNIILPIYEQGMICQYFGPEPYSRYYGYYGNGDIGYRYILNSLGFFLSGKNENDELWSNGVQSGMRINDYIRGPVGTETEKSLFKNSAESEPFGSDWEAWEKAVEQGAEFYDGNGDGIYNPVDINGNGLWDEGEDRPPLYGDITIWSVYNDGLDKEYRKTENVEPQGIEIQQTLWAYKTINELQSTFFIKYSLVNKGTVSDNLDSVYFSLSANGDVELGWRAEEYIGSNPKGNSAYIYSRNRNSLYGSQLAFLVTQIQGPVVLSNNPDDSAIQLRGEDFDYVELSGMKNLNVVTVGNINSESYFNDVETVRDISKNAVLKNPCEDTQGYVSKINCSDINDKFLYSGDPVLLKGWINNYGSDKTIFMSSGPFKLEKGKPVEIIYAVIVSEAEEGIEALREANKTKQYVDYFYYYPPEPLPSVNPTIISNQNSIELIWETDKFFRYNSSGYGYNMMFEGFNVHMYETNSTADEINGQPNAVKIMSYDVENHINRILIEDDQELDIDVIYEGGTQLDGFIYSNPQSGRIILTIKRDPFNLGTLKIGKPYFISVTPFAINNNDLSLYDYDGSYLIPRLSNYGFFEPEKEILNDNSGNLGIVIGESENSQFYKGVVIDHTEGNSQVEFSYSIYDHNSVTDDLYEIGFSRNSNELYSVNMYVKNLTQNSYLIKDYPAEQFRNDITNLTDGFLLNYDWVGPGIDNYQFEGEEQWFEIFNNLETGVFYVGRDTYNQDVISPISPRKFSTAVSADKLADIDLIFGDSSKAYRYLREAVRYLYTGFPDEQNGFTNIPVSAYRKNLDGSETKLSIGFLENAFIQDTLAHPDLKWNPGSDLNQSKEYLIIFNSEYSDNPGNHLVYTGTAENPANISLGYNLRSENDSLNFVARSPWFDAMYIIGFETEYYDPGFSPGGRFSIVANKVLSVNDKYTFKVKTEKSLAEKKAQFDNIKIFPNPLFAGNDLTSYYGRRSDEPFITFSHLPEEVTIRIFTIGGIHVKSIHKNDPSTMYKWDLKNESGISVASGMFIAVVESEELGKKILKFAIIVPQKQIHY